MKLINKLSLAILCSLCVIHVANAANSQIGRSKITWNALFTESTCKYNPAVFNFELGQHYISLIKTTAEGSIVSGERTKKQHTGQVMTDCPTNADVTFSVINNDNFTNDLVKNSLTAADSAKGAGLRVEVKDAQGAFKIIKPGNNIIMHTTAEGNLPFEFVTNYGRLATDNIFKAGKTEFKIEFDLKYK